MDEYDEPIDDLRSEPEITARDVADPLGVTPASVRRWAARGYTSPVGKFGPSNLFNTRDVLTAHDDIEGRRKASGQAAASTATGWICVPSTASGRSTTTRSSTSAKPPA